MDEKDKKIVSTALLVVSAICLTVVPTKAYFHDCYPQPAGTWSAATTPTCDPPYCDDPCQWTRTTVFAKCGGSWNPAASCCPTTNSGPSQYRLGKCEAAAADGCGCRATTAWLQGANVQCPDCEPC